jgi:DinB superfamily
MSRPDPTEYAPYYGKYLTLVPDDDILAALEKELGATLTLLGSVPEEQACVHHPPYTWSIKEVVGHLIDSERVFGYRALRIARADATPLAGFDENAYARAAEFDLHPLTELTAEFEAVRRSHLWLFRHLTEAAWSRRGVANNNDVSVRALAYILVGHERHHTAIIRRRLSSASARPVA